MTGRISQKKTLGIASAMEASARYSGQGVVSDGLRRRPGSSTVFPKCELTLLILVQVSYTLLTRAAAVRLVPVALLHS
jgi:hypothetical protein